MITDVLVITFWLFCKHDRSLSPLFQHNISSLIILSNRFLDYVSFISWHFFKYFSYFFTFARHTPGTYRTFGVPSVGQHSYDDFNYKTAYRRVAHFFGLLPFPQTIYIYRHTHTLGTCIWKWWNSLRFDDHVLSTRSQDYGFGKAVKLSVDAPWIVV